MKAHLDSQPNFDNYTLIKSLFVSYFQITDQCVFLHNFNIRIKFLKIVWSSRLWVSREVERIKSRILVHLPKAIEESNICMIIKGLECQKNIRTFNLMVVKGRLDGRTFVRRCPRRKVRVRLTLDRTRTFVRCQNCLLSKRPYTAHH